MVLPAGIRDSSSCHKKKNSKSFEKFTFIVAKLTEVAMNESTLQCFMQGIWGNLFPCSAFQFSASNRTKQAILLDRRCCDLNVGRNTMFI